MWSVIGFSKKYSELTLPQLVFRDPDFLFWAHESGAFKKRRTQRVDEVVRKAKSIRIPQGDDQMIAEYAVHAPTGKFASLELVPESRPDHVGSTRTFRRNVIDLSVPHEIASYDKLGNAQIIANAKYILFGDSSYKMTKKRAEAFFDDEANFEPTE